MNEMKGQQQFEVSLQQFLRSVVAMMSHNTDHTLVAQGACLKYLPSSIPDILTVFNARQLRWVNFAIKPLKVSEVFLGPIMFICL